MRFGADNLRDRALLALEEAVQECRFRIPRRNSALRFALAYLWATGSAARSPFDQFWKALDETSMWRFSSADQALSCIYRELGVERDHDLGMRVWGEQLAKEKAGRGQ